jgi:hypothetical protein
MGFPHILMRVAVATDRGPGEWETHMLETIAVVLVLLWLLGFVTSYTMGGLIHILLIAALVVILIRFMQGRRI